MARAFYANALAVLREEAASMPMPEEGAEYQSNYLGSFMALDPCGRYHHCLSPNGATGRCEAFWEALERAAGRLGGWIEAGEGDPTDIFFCLPLDEAEDEEE